MPKTRSATPQAHNTRPPRSPSFARTSPTSSSGDGRGGLLTAPAGGILGTQPELGGRYQRGFCGIWDVKLPPDSPRLGHDPRRHNRLPVRSSRGATLT